MLLKLWRALFARRCSEAPVQDRVLVDRVTTYDPRYVEAMRHLQRLDLSEEELRTHSALDAFFDPRTQTTWWMVIVEDGPAPLCGLECYKEPVPAPTPTK